MSRKHVLAAVLAAGAIAPATASAAPPAPTFADHAIIARDIIPSGEPGDVPPPAGADQQAKMYNALTPLFNHVTNADLLSDFKSDALGAVGPGPFAKETPRPGVTIYRDNFDVAHIFGVTRDDVTWGAGWVLVQDRGLLLQQARFDSRVAAIDAPGLSALGLISGLENFKPTAQTERELAKQTKALEASGAKGRAVLHDIDVYLDGINAAFKAEGSTAPPFTRNDIYALNALKDQFVGEGGGDEAVRSEFLTALQRKFGAKRGRAVWDDLREANDPEAPASVRGNVRFQPPPKNDNGNVNLDPGSMTSAATKAVGAYEPRAHASNALMVSGARSATHHPIMVAGPQIGYFYPGLTMEVDLEGPGISQRGATSAPFPGYIFIGRSPGRGLVADVGRP